MITPVNAMVPSYVIQKLPLDAAARILWDLSPRDISNMRLCSRHWVLVSETYLQEHCLPQLRTFMGVLSESLKVEAILSEVNAYKGVTFFEMSKWFLKLRDDLVGVLKKIDFVRIRELAVLTDGIQKPLFFNKVFALAEIMKKITPHEYYKRGTEIYNKELAGNMIEAAMKVCCLGCSAKAFELVDQMPFVYSEYSAWHYEESKGIQFAAFRLQIQLHASLGLFDEIVKRPRTIPLGGWDSTNALSVICEELVKAGQRDRAEELLVEFPCEEALKKMNKAKTSDFLTKDQVIAMHVNLEHDCKAVRINRI